MHLHNTTVILYLHIHTNQKFHRHEPYCSFAQSIDKLDDSLSASLSVCLKRLLRSRFHRPANRTLTWKLILHQFSTDVVNIRQSILQALHDCTRSTHLSFREVDQHENADLHFAFVSANCSAGLAFDDFHGQVAHSFPLESVRAGHIYLDSTDRRSHT